jgi:hypothetical protein
MLEFITAKRSDREDETIVVRITDNMTNTILFDAEVIGGEIFVKIDDIGDELKEIVSIETMKEIALNADYDSLKYINEWE